MARAARSRIAIILTLASAERFLYPVMTVGGPGNQYSQLLECALIARALDRTLVLAPFLSWVHEDAPQHRERFDLTFDAAYLAAHTAVTAVSALPAGATLGPVLSSGTRPTASALRTICRMGQLACAAHGTPEVHPLDHAEKACRAKHPRGSALVRCVFGGRWDARPLVGVAVWHRLEPYWGGDALRAPDTLRLVGRLRRARRVRALAGAALRALFGVGGESAEPPPPLLCVHLRRVEDDSRCREAELLRAGRAGLPNVACPPGRKGFVATQRVAAMFRFSPIGSCALSVT